MSVAQLDAPRRVLVFGLGGTIAMTAHEAGGVIPAMSVKQVVAAVPGLADIGIYVEVEDFRRVPGASHATSHPVVVTGAMRNPTMAGADGSANLLAAVQVAASPQARQQGCLVVLADEIHAARRVRKMHSTSNTAFQSPNGGPLGYVVEGQARIINRLGLRLDVPAKRRDGKRVGLVTVVLGDDGLVLEHLAERVDGLVVAALGVGHVPGWLVPPLEKIATRIPVVLASRTGAGSVLASTYGFPGSERDLLNCGLIAAGFLDPLKARILLYTLLTAEADHDAIAVAFGVAGGYINPERWPWHRPIVAGESEGIADA